MLSRLASEGQRPLEDSDLSAPCALWPVDLKLTHLDCNPEDTLVHFQGQYLTVCDLDYNILQVEIQNAPKTEVSVEMGEFCLVEDVLSGRWYRGRVQNKQNDHFDVFLLDHGNILTVDASHLASASDDMFMLPPKIVCGFFANVLPLQEHWDSLSVKYFSSLIGSEIKGYIQGLLPHKVLIMEAPDINKDIIKLGLGKHVDRDTFLLLVEMLTEVPLKQSNEPVPDLLLKKQIEQEFSFKPSSLQGFESILSFCGPKLSVGKKEQARVTAAVNPGTFYCQLTSMWKDLKAMSDKLSLACESESKNVSDRSIGNLGLLCSVKGKDEKWHRGFVQFLPVNSQVRVLFVDYGFCDSVKVENILQLPPEFLSMPIVAFPCALSCLSDQDETVLKKQLIYLKRGLLGDVLDIQIDSFHAEQNLYSVTFHDSEPSVDVDLQEWKSPAHETIKTDTFYDFEKMTKEHISKNFLYLKETKEESIFEGYVEHILNPTNFWLRTKERNHDFEEMMKNMTEYFDGLQLDEGILESPVPGALCCAMYEKDLHYYRAVVTDTIENGAKVFFIDFGNTEKVPYMLIKTMPPKFALEPAFALKCSLAHVVPLEDVWTVAATDYFRQKASNKALLVYVVHKRTDGYVVDLHEKGNHGHSISMLMTTAKMAEEWKFIEPVERTNKAKKFKQASCMASESGNELNASGISGIHKNASLGQNSELSAQCPARNASVATQISKQSAPIGTSASFKILTFRPGNELAVRCSYINSPSDFWCQLEGNLTEFDKMMQKMQWHYQRNADPWQRNDPCCIVKWSHNGKWYRGCVLRAQEDEVDVIFVDIGMVVKEKMHNLRAIKAEYLELEGQAFRCSLYSIIEPADHSLGVWHTGASDFLKQFMKENSQNLKCTIYTQLLVKNIGLSNVVDLYTLDKSVTKLLVDTGLARMVQSPKLLVPSVYPYSYTYSLFNMDIGNKEPVYVTHVCSPWELYFQLYRNGEILEDLMEKATKAFGETQVPHAAQGRLCLAKYFVDGKWYRGLAYPVQSSFHLNVFFVDYGNMQVVEKSNVLPIPRHATDLLYVPMLALKCSLADVPQREELADVNGWLEKAVRNKLLQATFVAKDEEGTIICELFDGSMCVNKKVKELIEIHGHREQSHIDGKVVKNTEKVGDTTKALTVIGKIQERNECLKVKGVSEMSKGCYKTQNASDRKMSKKTSKSPKTKTVNFQKENECHSKAKKNEYTHVKSKATVDFQTYKHNVEIKKLKPATINSLPKLSHLPETQVKCGFTGIGFVSHVRSATSFYIQMEDDEQAIVKMGEELNGALLKETLENITGELMAGDIVAGEYKEDGALYRAVVVDVLSEAKIKVEFIDYGNEAIINKNNIRKLQQTFLTLPRLSIPCSLDKSHIFQCDASFELSVAGKPLHIEFVRQSALHWIVNIEMNDESLSHHGLKENPNSKDCKLLETKNGHVNGSTTNGEKALKRCCLDTPGTIQMAKNATADSRKSTNIEKTAHLAQEEPMKCFVPSQNLETSQEVTSPHTQGMQKKSAFLIKSNKHAICELHKRKKMYRHKKQAQKCKRILGRPFYLSETKIIPNSKYTPELPISQTEAVPDLFEHVQEGQTKHLHIPHQNIRAGRTENVTLLSFLENGDLYVRLNKNSGLLALLDTLITGQSLKGSTLSKSNIKAGLECLAKSDRNNQWYRAVVQNTSNGECSVLLIDHGTTEVVSVDCIKEICRKLQVIPMQAVLCKWNGPGYPIEGAYEMLKKTLKPLVNQNVRLKFVSYSEISQTWLVEIMINGVFLLQQLKATSCQKHREDDESSTNFLCTQIMEKPLLGKTSSFQTLTVAPVQMDFGHTSFASAVTTPFEFSIVLENMLLIMSTVAATLETLPKDLDSLPEAVLIPGACCLVKSETKKKWCRAEIVHVDNISVVINLVDYGHCAHIPYTCRSNLKRLPEELAKLPKVTYPCVLRGVKPAGVELWTDEAVIFFQQCICQKSLTIYFRQHVSEAQWEVDVVAGGVNVAKELVDAGHASYIDSMLGLRLHGVPSPAEAPHQEFFHSFLRSTVRIKLESKPAEVEDECLLKLVGFDKNIHISEHVEIEDHQSIDNAKNLGVDKRTIWKLGNTRGREAFENEQKNIQGTKSKKLKAMLGKGKFMPKTHAVIDNPVSSPVCFTEAAKVWLSGGNINVGLEYSPHRSGLTLPVQPLHPGGICGSAPPSGN